MNASLLVLHDHWLTAEGVFDYVEADFVEPTPTFRKVFEDRSRMYRTSEVWIALIYVVIEGYEGLNARDKRIDALLTDTDRVTALRRFRNALFHPQRGLYGKKFTDFMFDENNHAWCVAVNAAFRAFFAREVPTAE
jgi:hypothetical protein